MRADEDEDEDEDDLEAGEKDKRWVGDDFMNMPAKSKKQQMAAGAALSAKRGETKKSSLKGASKQMAKMSEKKLEEFAGTKRKKLPTKKKSAK